MRCYTVTATLPSEDEEEDVVPTTRFAGSQSDAATIKRDWFEEHKAAGLKRNSIEIVEVEIPTNPKPAFIVWLNENVA